MKRAIFLLMAFMAIATLLHAAAVHAVTNETQNYANNGVDVSVSLMNQDPDPAVAGDVADVRVGVQNNGGVSAGNLVLEMVPQYPFSVAPGEQAAQSVGTIQQYQGASNSQYTKVLNYRVLVDKDATAGTYNMKFAYYPQGQSEAASQVTVPVRVQNKQSAEVIHIDKSVIIPGKQSDLKFTINNVGSSPLRDLAFSWSNDEKIILPVGSDNTRYIKNIDIGQGVDLDYQVIADTNAQPGLYKLNLFLTYQDPTTHQNTNITTSAGVYVGGGTDFEVAYSESTSGETSFSVANIGSNPANSVSVVIPQQQGWRVSGSNSVIIGNLNKGDYTVASFRLQPSNSTGNYTRARRQGAGQPDVAQLDLNTSGDAPRASPADAQNGALSGGLRVQVAYTDTMGQRLVVEKQVPLDAQSMAAASQMGIGASARGQQNQSLLSKYWYVVALVAIVAGYFGYRRYNANKHRPQAPKSK